MRLEAPLHINFDLCKQSDGYVAMVIIHEGSHAWGNTIDYAYVNQAEYRTKLPNELGKNADSHAFVAMSIAAGKLLDSDAEVIKELFD